MNEKDNIGKVDVSESFKKEGESNLAPAENIKEKSYEYKKHDFKPKENQASGRNSFLDFYDKNYKKLLVIPLAVVLLSVLVLLFSYNTTGEFFEKDVSIKGGVTVTVLANHDNLDDLQQRLADSLGTPVNARKLSEAGIEKGVIFDAGIESDAEVDNFLSLIGSEFSSLDQSQFSVQVIGSTLGASFFKAVVVSILVAFALMALVVFIYFRFAVGSWILVPSFFIIWTVFVDMICTLAVVSLLNIKVSTAGLAAFLLLIGYSVDTDILLTMRMLKGRQEKILDRILGAARTGIFMTLAGMAAVVAGSLFTQSETIRQIMVILAIGLAFDLLHTWITNTGVLRWYMERNLYGTK